MIRLNQRAARKAPPQAVKINNKLLIRDGSRAMLYSSYLDYSTPPIERLLVLMTNE
jgi:hypothetical protein